MPTELSRRQFLAVGGGTLVLPFVPHSRRAPSAGPVRIGIIADLHHGLEPTALARLETFVTAAGEREVDAIVQLGDFNYGTSDSRECTALWEQFDGQRVHVLGNHDMDKCSKEEILEAWSMPGCYGSRDQGGFHFVVLDRNNLKTPNGYVAYDKGNYFAHPEQRGFADAEQLEWLRADLAATELPTVVYVHQGIGMQDEPYPDGDPRAEIEAVLAAANRDREAPKVIACFCGHHHLDRHNHRDGVHYVWVNSASYYWVGSKYGRMAAYRDALFGFVTFDPEGVIEIEGRRSDWVAPTPADRGFPRADELTAQISDRRLAVRVQKAFKRCQAPFERDSQRPQCHLRAQP